MFLEKKKIFRYEQSIDIDRKRKKQIHSLFVVVRYIDIYTHKHKHIERNKMWTQVLNVFYC
jgi:hypothetical protein